MREDLQNTGSLSPVERFEDFFEHSQSGFLMADAQGIVVKSNIRLTEWMGAKEYELAGKRFSDLLTIAGKIYYETHLWPLLRMQGFFDEVVVELDNPFQRLRVLINAVECHDKDNKPQCIYYTIMKATDRLQYEQNLQYAKTVAEKELVAEKENVLLREQLIAILGHDLRNPLGAISMVTHLLQESLSDPINLELLATLKRSNNRMAELINNTMDFARTRLGDGIIIKSQNVELEPVFQQVVGELKLIFPKRDIISSFDIPGPVHCDPYRISQLLSNLLANALTHGSPDKAVYIRATHKNATIKLEVCNSGAKIPFEMHERLFAPFTKEGSRPSQNGLGLGLYISAEIARGHNATLKCTSSDEETCFTFEMPY